MALIEKGAEIGAHEVSGAILNPRALAELIPAYQARGCLTESVARKLDLYAGKIGRASCRERV